MVDKKLTEKTFDEILSKKEESYTFDIRKMGRRDRQIIKHLNKYGIKGKKCLDIGAGTGRWLQFLKESGALYLGAIDISQVSIDKYKNICDKTQKADIEAEKFNFEDKFFDVILSFMVLEHLRDPENYISEIARVTKKDALILMSIPNIVSLKSRLRVLLGFLPQAVSGDFTHVSFYTKRELVKLFGKHGFKVKMIPTSVSFSPFGSKKMRIPSASFMGSLDDHLLFELKRI